MPAAGVPKACHDEILTFEQIIRFVRALQPRFQLGKVRITGGDPLVRRGTVGLIEMLAAEGINDLALTTNGQRLAEMAGDLKQAGLRRVNISLDSLDPKTFETLTRGGSVEPVLEGIDAAVSHGLAPVKINTVVLRGYNDGEVASIAQYALERGCQIRFLELMPIGCARSAFKELFVPTSEVRASLERSFNLEPRGRELGGSSRDYVASDAHGRSGTVGFISPESEPFCEDCSRMRLTSTGRLIACLARGEGRDIGGLLRNWTGAHEQTLSEIVAAELASKCARTTFHTPRPMAAVGG